MIGIKFGPAFSSQISEGLEGIRIETYLNGLTVKLNSQKHSSNKRIL